MKWVAKFVHKRDLKPLKVITYDMTFKSISDLFFHYKLIILLAYQ